MRGTTSFTIYYVENLFEGSFRSSLNCLSCFVVVILGDEVDGVSELR